jgi:ABC-2 type transport system ATP-binding protein
VQAALRDAPGVIAVAQIGASVRVLAAADDHFEQHAAARFARAGVMAAMQPASPSLEDVFVSATAKVSEHRHEPA